MVTHLTVPGVDDSPAIVSSKIISGWLKNDLSFTGPVITDDLLMEAALTIGPVENLVIDSFAAGNDLLLFGQDLNQGRKAFDSFAEAWNRDLFDNTRQVEALKRVDTIMQKVVS
jgi:beta-N-acetylhexosaminidase